MTKKIKKSHDLLHVIKIFTNFAPLEKQTMRQPEGSDRLISGKMTDRQERKGALKS
ncbi:MAG: hypothetical protein HDT05_05455 [Bacteroidales bacterium]|nr:hypothetical protein [Bacteroidales bacterium]